MTLTWSLKLKYKRCYAFLLKTSKFRFLSRWRESRSCRIRNWLCVCSISISETRHWANVLARSELLVKTSITIIQTIFEDEKQVKQILSVSKRVSKKWVTYDDTHSTSVSSKRTKKYLFASTEQSSTVIEDSLILPSFNVFEEKLRETILYTNRASLILAFAVTLLRHTLSNQSLFSRLSLA